MTINFPFVCTSLVGQVRFDLAGSGFACRRSAGGRLARWQPTSGGGASMRSSSSELLRVRALSNWRFCLSHLYLLAFHAVACSIWSRLIRLQRRLACVFPALGSQLSDEPAASLERAGFLKTGTFSRRSHRADGRATRPANQSRAAESCRRAGQAAAR